MDSVFTSSESDLFTPVCAPRVPRAADPSCQAEDVTRNLNPLFVQRQRLSENGKLRLRSPYAGGWEWEWEEKLEGWWAWWRLRGAIGRQGSTVARCGRWAHRIGFPWDRPRGAEPWEIWRTLSFFARKRNWIPSPSAMIVVSRVAWCESAWAQSSVAGPVPLFHGRGVPPGWRTRVVSIFLGVARASNVNTTAGTT